MLEKRWRTATVVGLDGFRGDGGVLEIELTFQTRVDQRSGEQIVVSPGSLLEMMFALNVKKMSELIGKACIICVESDGKTVTAVDHFFAKNPVETP